MAVNLVRNALDAVEDVDDRQVVVRTRIVRDAAVLDVEDAGPGMAPDVVAHAFEPFVTSKPPGRGTGLGLYITQVLVERSGGEVHLETPVAGGTHVRVRLPVQAAGEAPAAASG